MKLRILVFYLTLTWSYLPSITFSTKVQPDTTNNNASAANSQDESAQNISVDECTCQDPHDPTDEVDGNNQSIDNRNVQQHTLETVAQDSDDHEVGVTPEPMQVDTQQSSTQSSSDDVSHHRSATGNSITTDPGLNECLVSYDLRIHQRPARSNSTSHQGAAKVEMEVNETTDYTCPSAVQGNAANPRSIQMLAELQLDTLLFAVQVFPCTGSIQIPGKFQGETIQRAVQNGSRRHDQRLAVVNFEANETEEIMLPNTVLNNSTDTFSNQQFSSQGVTENNSSSRGQGLASALESFIMTGLQSSETDLNSTINTRAITRTCPLRHGVSVGHLNPPRRHDLQPRLLQRPSARQTGPFSDQYRRWVMRRCNLGVPPHVRMRSHSHPYRSTRLLNEQGLTVPSGRHHLRSTPGNPPSTLVENLPQLPPTTAYSDNNADVRNSQTLTTHRDNGSSSSSRAPSQDRNVDQENSQRPTSNVHIQNNKNSRNLYSRRAP